MDYYTRPPSPPRTLKDQMQVAYALDNMHLAKILYLRLNGIEVTGDDDPRIEAVKDEDFSSSFVPPGGLVLDEADEQRCRESERRERERIRRLRREERLRACERKWERSTLWVREENAKIARRKEEELREKRRLEREAKEREREREAREREQEMLRHTRQLRISALTQRPLLNYNTLSTERGSKRQSPVRPVEDDPLQYSDIPVSPRRSPSSYSISPPSTPDKNTLTLPRMCHELALQHSQSLSRTVRFADVVTSMRGPLFPLDDRSNSRAKLSTSQRELFESLFEPVEWERDERSAAKGKSKGKADSGLKQQTTVQHRESGNACVACSLNSTSTSVSVSASAVSSSVSTVTRSNSWFSFGSRSSRSTASTALTTPSSSLLSFKSASQSPPAPSLAFVLHAEPKQIRHSCQQPVLVPVRSSEDPLTPLASHSVHSKDLGPEFSDRGRSRIRGELGHRTPSRDNEMDVDGGLVHRVSRSVSSLMDMAAQFQRAYVKATLFSVGTDSFSRSRSRDTSGSRSPSRSSWRARRTATSGGPSGRSGKLKPEGYRALSFDVHVFLDPVSEDSSEVPQPTRTLIPLHLRIADSLMTPPHTRVFSPPASPPRSPFRLAQPLPGCPSLPRLRPVANPVLLRLQALQNICAGRALTWEGRAREGRMSAGKEKLVGIAWEGIGRSSLGWEVVGATVSC